VTCKNASHSNPRPKECCPADGSRRGSVLARRRLPDLWANSHGDRRDTVQVAEPGPFCGNYRLVPATGRDGAVDDCQDAIQWRAARGATRRADVRAGIRRRLPALELRNGCFLQSGQGEEPAHWWRFSPLLQLAKGTARRPIQIKPDAMFSARAFDALVAWCWAAARTTGGPPIATAKPRNLRALNTSSQDCRGR